MITNQIRWKLNRKVPFAFSFFWHGISGSRSGQIFALYSQNVKVLQTSVSNLGKLVFHGPTDLEFEPASVIRRQIQSHIDFLSFGVSFGDDSIGKFASSFVKQRSLDWISAHSAFSVVVFLVAVSATNTRVVIPIRGIFEAESES